MKRLSSQILIITVLLTGTIFIPATQVRATDINCAALNTAFTVDPNQGGYLIPSGSTINQYNDGGMIVVGPNDKIILQTSDSNSSIIPSPDGPIRANHFFKVPSGTSIYLAKDATKYYYNQTLILTIVHVASATPSLISSSVSIGYEGTPRQMSRTLSTISPTIFTTTATDIGFSYAILNGNLTDLGSASSVTVSFEYGTTTSYGNTVTASPPSLSSPGTFSSLLGAYSLTPGTVYHYRAKAVGDGTSYGEDQQFTTPFGGHVETVNTGYLSTVTDFSANWFCPQKPTLNQDGDNSCSLCVDRQR